MKRRETMKILWCQCVRDKMLLSGMMEYVSDYKIDVVRSVSQFFDKFSEKDVSLVVINLGFPFSIKLRCLPYLDGDLKSILDWLTENALHIPVVLVVNTSFIKTYGVERYKERLDIEVISGLENIDDIAKKIRSKINKRR